MLIGGIQKFTMLDYPDKAACVAFTPGCNFRCGYCHNPEFVLPELLEKIRGSLIPEEAFFNFLEERKNFLDGVVITGGEPTLAPDLAEFIKKVKELGFLVKLDTNGSSPGVLNDLLDKKLLDYIAMDVKTSLDRYQELAGPGADPEKIKQSVELIKDSGILHEFRATILKEIHPREVLEDMAKLVEGSERFYLQAFRPDHVLDSKFSANHPFSTKEIKEIAELFNKHTREVRIRS